MACSQRGQLGHHFASARLRGSSASESAVSTTRATSSLSQFLHRIGKPASTDHAPATSSIKSASLPPISKPPGTVTPWGIIESDRQLEDTPTPSWRSLTQREAVLFRDECLISGSGSGSGSSSCKTSETAWDEEDDESNNRDDVGDGGDASGWSMGAGGDTGDDAVSGSLKKVLEVGTSIFSPSSCSTAAKYTLCLTLTDLFNGQYTQWPCDLTLSPIHRPSQVRRSNFELVGSCTHTFLPKHFKCDKSGSVPYNASQGVIPPSARINVRFFSHVKWRNTSPHMLGGSAAMCSSACTFSPRVQFKCSVIH